MKAFKYTTILSAICSLSALLWIAYVVYGLMTLDIWIDVLVSDWDLIFKGYVCSYIAHIVVLGWIVHTLPSIARTDSVAKAALLCGTLSTIWLFLDFLALSDIS